jgi:hypothetical protein
VNQKPAVEPKYSVLLLHVQDFPRPQEHREQPREQQSAAGQGQLRAAAGSAGAKSSPPEAAPAPEQEARLRAFVLPPSRPPDRVKQTLVQFDVPPEIQLKREVALPTALIWPDRIKPVRKNFVAPVAREKPKPVVNMPAAPELSAPNRETTIADLKIASDLLSKVTRPFRAPAKTAPIRGTGVQPVAEPPQIGTSDLAEAAVTPLISLPDAPLRSGQVVVVPPANQIAAAGAGSGGAGGGGGSGGSTNQNQGSRGVVGTGVSASSGAAGSSVAGTSGLGAGASANGASGNGASGTGASGSGEGDLPLSATTRLTMPKEGKFGLIVAGTSAAAPYAESIGALSGKMVYSVFLDVGLRKKWLLQYCLPRAEEQKVAVRGRAEPLGAPWPYLVVRPSATRLSAEYVVVHGMITADGRFDKLALVFPRELDKNDLLMRSLAEWTFRPASRDGVAADVEILLIVPRQPD